MMSRLAVLSAIFLVATLRADAQSVLYVSPAGSDSSPGTEAQPFRTLDRARTAVRALNDSMTQDVVVYLRGGEYALTAPLVLDASDSGSNGYWVRWRAYPGETPTVTGGQRVVGWTSVGNNVHKASVGGLRFRQLYVNGTRAVRARRPDLGNYNTLRSWDTGGRRIEVGSAEIASWAALNQVEMVILGKGVNQASLRVASFSVSGTSAWVVALEPERARIFQQTYPPKESRPYYFENALELLDSPGEWYLRTATNELFYMPRPGEDLSTAVVVAPVADSLLRIQGTLDAPIHHVEVRGVTFEHSTWLSPSSEGFIGDQASTEFVQALPADQVTSYPSRPLPAAIHVAAAHHIAFERNVLRHLGSSAINFFVGVQDSSFVGNVISDVSGSGVSVDLNLEGNPTDTRKICRRVTLSNNYIAHVGRDYYQSVGIMTAYSDAAIIEHNEVHDISYSGISVGWGWNDVANAARNNLIRYNDVYDVLDVMADGGGIYTLSRQPGTLIAENYVHDIGRYAWHGSFAIAGIYLDEGSNLITVRDNAVINTADYVVFTHATGTGNTITNNGSGSATVIQNAGLEAAYRDIRPSTPVVGAAFGFDEGSGTTAADTSGSGRTAVLANGAGWGAGKFGSAVDLDGTNDYVFVDSPGLPIADFTWMAWVRPDQLRTFQTIFEAQGSSVAELEVNVTASGSINLWFDGVSRITTARTLPIGTWSHLAVRRSGTTITVLIDGVADANSATSSVPLGFSNCPLLVGVDADQGCSGALNGFFDGRIDELRIYGRGLSDAEIVTDLNTPISTPAGQPPASPANLRVIPDPS